MDQNRTEELTRKVNETFVPRLSKLEGFSDYYLVEAGDGIMSSIAFFETAEQGEASTRLASSWVRDEKLESILPNAPKITSGRIVSQERSLVPVA